MMYAVTVDHGSRSEVVEFPHDGRRKNTLIASAVKQARVRGGTPLLVAPVGGGPTDVRRISRKTREAYDA